MKRLLCFVLCTAMLCGCSIVKENNGNDTYNPPPSPAVSQDMEAPGEVKAVLYFLNGEENKLIGETRSITFFDMRNLAESAIDKLIRGPQNTVLKNVIGSGVYLDYVEVSDELACVYMNTQGALPSAKEMFVFEAAAANTLTDLLGVYFVNVFWNGLNKGFSGLPTGPVSKNTGDIAAKFDELISQRAAQNEYMAKQYRAILYFAAKGGRFILPEVRNIAVTGDDYVKAVIEELKKGPASAYQKSAVLDKDMELQKSEIIGQGDTRTLALTFTGFPKPYEFKDPASEVSAYASIVYTLTGFLPDIDSVRFIVDGEETASLPGFRSFQDGMRRSDFADRIGKSIKVYLRYKDSALLTGVSRTIAQTEQWDITTRLKELFKGPVEGDSDTAWPVIPAGIGERDILSVMVNRDILYLDLSANFVESCKSLTGEAEMLLVYGIVNTLSEVNGIRRVKFLAEGKEIEKLAGYLYLKNPLIKNPGLIKS